MTFGKILTPKEARDRGVPDTAYVVWTPSAKQAEALKAAKLKESPPAEEPPLPTQGEKK